MNELACSSEYVCSEFKPSVSIIIAVKNAKEGLMRSLDSIRAQEYSALETIVIDGGSTDGSTQLFSEYQDVIKHAVSERDGGISDAFNKGIGLATGEYIYFLGAGDTLIDPHGITTLFKDLDESYQLVCGKIVRVKEDGITPLWEAPQRTGVFDPSAKGSVKINACTQGLGVFDRRALWFKMPLPHQGLFTHRDYFKQHGLFDTTVKYAMDYELLLRAYHHFPKTIIKDVKIARWQAGGIGSHRLLELFDEYYKIKLKHRVAPKWLLKLIDSYTRLKYYVKTKLLKKEY